MKDLFGTTHTPVYSCPFCKAAPHPSNGYSRKWQWKTARGLAQHHCYRDEQARAEAQAAKRTTQEAEYIRLFAEYVIPQASHKVGDMVAFVYYTVLEPTHRTNQWGRTVRVRYEETRHYTASQEAITAIIPVDPQRDPDHLAADLAAGKLPAVRYRARWYEFGERDIYPTLAEAEASAEHAQAAYDAACRHAEFCR